MKALRLKFGTLLLSLLLLQFISAGKCIKLSKDSSNDDTTESVTINDAGVPSNDDLSDPGDPTSKSKHTEGEDTVQGTFDHYDFSSDNYFVKSETLHGTTVEVAVHNDLQNGSGPSQSEFAEFAIKAWHIAWHIFGGYKYDRYAVKVRGRNVSESFSLSATGISITSGDYESGNIYAFVAHEMFHSWLGKLIQYKPDGTGNLFQLETWVNEGTVSYYELRNAGFARDRSIYDDNMKTDFDFYKNRIGTRFDLKFSELAQQIGTSIDSGTDDQEYTDMLYTRGQLVSYMLDKELKDSFNSSLDKLLQYLYKNFGLKGLKWQQGDLLDALNELVGSSFSTFFDTYVHSNTQLPLDGNFILIKR